MIALPNKLSDLLDLAVSDANKCVGDPRYLLNMKMWHAPNAGVCEVCMAGAVLAQTLRIAPERRVLLWDDTQEADIQAARLKLLAINEMRVGNFGAKEMAPFVGIDTTPEQEDALDDARREIQAYFPDDFDEEDGDIDELTDFVAPWEAYTKAAQVLRAAGL